MEELVYLLKKTQEELKKELYNYLSKKGMNPLSADGFLYAKGDIPVLLVAHMDTVSDYPPEKIYYEKKHDALYNPYEILGGDDRCGIYAILKLLESYKPHVLFTEDEEIGCIGARKAVDNLEIPDIKYIIEFDRRGKDDCVFYNCGNEVFAEYVEKFGFKRNIGSFSDISILGSAWNIASVNLSSGYYNEHSPMEFIVFNHLQKTIKRADKMLKVIDKTPYFDYQDIRKNHHLSL